MRDFPRSPVREIRTPGSARGASGNRCPYLDLLKKSGGLKMTTPESQTNLKKPGLQCRGRYLAVVGLLLMLGTVVSFVFAFYSIAPRFDEDQLVSEIDLSSQIRSSIMVSMWGLGSAILGSILVGLAVLASKNRELWVYRNGMFLSVILCLAGGIFGTVFGVALIIILATRRSEFASRKNGAQNNPAMDKPDPVAS